MKTGEKVWPADSPMFRSSSLVKVTREGEQKTKQINKNTKSTRERSTKAAICGAILNRFYSDTPLSPSLHPSLPPLIFSLLVFLCHHCSIYSSSHLKLPGGSWQGKGWSMADPHWVPALHLVDGVVNAALPHNGLKHHVWKPLAVFYLSTRRSSDCGNCCRVIIVLQVCPLWLDIFIHLVCLKSAVLIIVDVYGEVCFPHRMYAEAFCKTLTQIVFMH